VPTGRSDLPTYQYACTACGHQLEAVQSFADDPLTVCPTCEGRLRKVFASVGVVFKGSGFYRTDSRTEASRAESKSGTKPESGDAKPAKSESGESTTKPETKTKAKSETKTTTPATTSG